MFFEIASYLYAAGCSCSGSERPIPAEYVNIAEQVFKKIGWAQKIKPVEIEGSVPVMPENNNIMIGLSGGLDSVYLMHKLKEEGYNITAFHVEGLNKSSAKLEEEYARAAAKDAGVDIVCVRFNAPKQAFPDNPFKNQLVLSLMLDKGINRGIYRYAVGSDWTTPLTEAVTGFTITDSVEVYREYWAGVNKRFPQAQLVFISDDEKKYERLQYLHGQNALDNVSSCVAPLRFRNAWHKNNERKYGVKLMKGRCGSCYKCAMEYILLVEAGLIPKDAAFYEHSWDIMAKSKTAHRPDLFAKNIPLSKRLENIKNYGS